MATENDITPAALRYSFTLPPLLPDQTSALQATSLVQQVAGADVDEERGAAAAHVTIPNLRDKLALLAIRQRQLHALLMMTYGEAADSFAGLVEEVRGDYLWACSDMAAECAKLGDEVETLAFAKA